MQSTEPPFRLLIADDDSDFRQAVRMLLAGDPCEIIEARDGAEALEIVEKVKPEMIISDVIMPGMHGTELCRRIKNNPELADTFIILVSGVKTQSEDQAIGLEVGADGYLTRPISHRELRARIRVFMRLRKTEKALEASEKKYRMLFETMIIGFALHEIILDEDGSPVDFKYLNINPEFEKITGLKAEKVIGQKATEIIDKLEYHWIEKYGYVALTGNELRFVEHSEALDKYFEVYAFSPQYGQFATLFYDVTQRFLAEEKIRLYNNQLQNLNASKDRFFSIIAHDLRGPIGSFHGLLELIDETFEEMSREEILAIIKTMKRTTLHLNSLVDNLLHWARLQKGNLQVNPETLTLLSLVEPSIEALQAGIDKKNLQITIEIPDNLSIRTDPEIFKMVFRNLLSNAIKFTPAGGRITTGAVATPDGYARIFVKDSGIGMDKETLDNLFTLEGLANRPGTEGEPSTGLGLILCHDLLRLQNSELQILTAQGKGTEMAFSLPVVN